MFYYRIHSGNTDQTAVTNVAGGVVIVANDAQGTVYEVNNTPTINDTQVLVKQAGTIDLRIPTAVGVGYILRRLKMSFSLHITGGDPGAANILTIVPTLNGNLINANLRHDILLVNAVHTDVKVSGIFILGDIPVTGADQELRLSLLYNVGGPYNVVVRECTI